MNSGTLASQGRFFLAGDMTMQGPASLALGDEFSTSSVSAIHGDAQLRIDGSSPALLFVDSLPDATSHVVVVNGCLAEIVGAMSGSVQVQDQAKLFLGPHVEGTGGIGLSGHAALDAEVSLPNLSGTITITGGEVTAGAARRWGRGRSWSTPPTRRLPSSRTWPTECSRWLTR